MLLPDSWVESLFARLTVRYGAAFVRQYADLDLAAVKADWAEVLGGFRDRPDALKGGLARLPADRPPNAMQFQQICRDASRDERQTAVPSLPAPVADTERVHGLVASVERQSRRDFKQWARDLRDREQGGERLSVAQRDAWRTALAESEPHQVDA